MYNKKQELEERLINFAVKIIELSEEMPNTRAGNNLAGQIVRSSSSPALNYGEAQAAESLKDFIHKIKIVLKELRETLPCLKIIHRAKLYQSEDIILSAMSENDELIAIFTKSAKTAERNLNLNQKTVRSSKTSKIEDQKS
jgi:four helix bundle protein